MLATGMLGAHFASNSIIHKISPPGLSSSAVKKKEFRPRGAFARRTHPTFDPKVTVKH